tara:strand:+ start:254 stop:1252 length:999 start_codon:yes stop_codon:yes gene_type:complete
MNLFGKKLEKEILYIAEIGVNHEGSLTRCKKLIRQAKQAGADVVKFQCFTPEKYVSVEEKKFSVIKKFFLNEKKFNEIIKFCKKIKIKYLFTPVSHDWLSYIKKNSEVVKIASGDLNFNFLLKLAAKYNLKIILSTGLSNMDEIKNALRTIGNFYKKNMKNKVVLMHCVSSYPVKDKDANMLSVKYLKDKFKLTTGYSNHVIGINACLASICMGARVIEFHFTDNKKRKFRDHMLSLDKHDVRKLINTGNNFNLLFGKYQKKIDNNLRKVKNILLKGIIVNKNLYKNQKIKIKDLTYARPAKFYNAGEINKIVGKKLKKNIKKGYLVRKSHF